MMVDQTGRCRGGRCWCSTSCCRCLGVLVAFPMKRRFINDEQQPFPEGARLRRRARHAVLRRTRPRRACSRPRRSPIAAAIARRLTSSSPARAYMKLHPGAVARASSASWHLPATSTAGTTALADEGHGCRCPSSRTSTSASSASPDARPGDVRRRRPDGHPRRPSSMLLGDAAQLRASSCRSMISLGEIQPRQARSRRALRVRARAHPQHLGAVVGHLDHGRGLARRPVREARGVRRARSAACAARSAPAATDVLAHIELPLWISFVGVPIVGAIGVWMAHAWFGVQLGPRRTGDPADHRARR